MRGLIFRAFRSELDRRGLLEPVLAHLQGDAKELLERPPPHSAWLPAPPYDEIVRAIGAETNWQTLRAIAYSNTKETTGPIKFRTTAADTLPT